VSWSFFIENWLKFNFALGYCSLNAIFLEIFVKKWKTRGWNPPPPLPGGLSICYREHSNKQIGIVSELWQLFQVFAVFRSNLTGLICKVTVLYCDRRSNNSFSYSMILNESYSIFPERWLVYPLNITTHSLQRRVQCAYTRRSLPAFISSRKNPEMQKRICPMKRRLKALMWYRIEIS
jgi:hypothetical protein